MARGRIIIYTTNDDLMPSLIRVGEKHGVGLTNPETGVITTLSVEEGAEGTQMPVDIDALSQAVVAGVTFQFWLSKDADVICEVRHLDAAIAWTFSLTGLRPDEVGTVTEWLLGAVAAAEGTAGLVLDRAGRGEDFDWDSLITAGPANPSAYPADLVLTVPRQTPDAG
jgi:hypothetical protein